MDGSAENLPIPQVSKDTVPKIVPPKRKSDITLRHEQALEERDGLEQAVRLNEDYERFLLDPESRKR
jgi:hypothetical protein